MKKIDCRELLEACKGFLAVLIGGRPVLLVRADVPLSVRLLAASNAIHGPF